MKHAFMIAATGSGVGKTTITCALLEALKEEYGNVRAFKCGPDYIDPMFHKNVLDIPSKNLDLFFTDKDKTRELFYKDNDSQISLVEGVMGLYDGINSSSNEGSSYHLACLLNIPVILLVDAHGMGRSLLAVIKGFLEMDENRQIKGILLNRISKSYFETVKPLIESELGVSVIGFFPKQSSEPVSSRYLGLKMPEEITGLKESIKEASEVIKESVDISKLLEISANNENEIYNPKTLSFDQRVRIAVARDQAFCFYYEDNLRLLREAGAELVEFSPLNDEKLPENICGLILGGGYPELHARKLAENETMKTAINEAIRVKKLPSLAECGGFMYLHDYITNDQGTYKMAGIIEGGCANTGKLVRFGYISLSEKEDTFWNRRQCIKGHEFHYYDSTHNGDSAIAIKPVSNKQWDCAHTGDNHWWGFAHLYYPSNPDFAECFVNKCRKWGEVNGQF